MPRVTYEVLSPAEKLECCSRLMKSLFVERQEVNLSELEYFLTTESIKFESRIKNQQGQSVFFPVSPPCIEMQPMLNTGTSTYEISSEDVLGINEYSKGLLTQLIEKLYAQKHNRIFKANKITLELNQKKSPIDKSLFVKLGAEVQEVLENAALEKDCLEAIKALEETKALLTDEITPQKIATYTKFASTIKTNRSSKSLENIAKMMLVIAGIALVMTLLVAFNVIAASGLLVIAGLVTAFFAGSIGSVLLFNSEPQSLGKAVNDIADNAESIHMLLGSR